MREGLASLIDRADSWLTPATAERYLSTWRDVPLHRSLVEFAGSTPGALAAVSYSRSGERRSLDYQQYDELSRRIAAGLSVRGVEPGSNVAVMLPNCHEFGATIFAVKRLGAVYTGIPVSYRLREMTYIVNHVGAQVLIVAGRHSRTSLQELAAKVVEDSRSIRHVVVFEPDGELPRDPRWSSFQDLVSMDPAFDATEVDPTAVCHIGFTSGTTGEPKGVMNTHNSLDTVMRGLIGHVTPEALGVPPVALVPSPVGHHTGYLWGVLSTSHLGGAAVFMEAWDPDRALDIINAESVTWMMVAPTFVQDLASVAERRGEPPTSLSLIVIAGAPIPRGLVSWAGEQLDCFICPAWGMTEWGVGISATPSMHPDLVQRTDGYPVPPCEIRVVNESGMPCIDELGELQMRGPGLFVGYHDRPEYTREAVDDDGWFRTGDMARHELGGPVVLEGRIKDIIIRGGLNVPVRELEDLIFGHADVLQVAVVGMPDHRLGERACAFVVAKEGRSLTLEDLVTYLGSQGLSTHYMPERLELLDELPRTMSGKIRKVELRALAASFSSEQ